MKSALLYKNGDVSGFPSDILINGEIRKSHNLEFECEKLGIDTVIGRSMPSDMIKKLRDKGVVFIKVKSVKELEGLDFDIVLPGEFNKKRGWGCSKTFP